MPTELPQELLGIILEFLMDSQEYVYIYVIAEEISHDVLFGLIWIS